MEKDAVKLVIFNGEEVRQGSIAYADPKVAFIHR
jgi:hypothetical protein